MWQAEMAPARQGKCVMCVMRHGAAGEPECCRANEVITNGFLGGRQAIGVVPGSGVRVPAAAGPGPGGGARRCPARAGR